MVRTQVQFPADQLEILREMAARQGVSVSNLVRHAVQRAGLTRIPESALYRIVGEMSLARKDAEPVVEWPGAEARRYRGELCLLPQERGETQLPGGRLSADCPNFVLPGMGCLKLSDAAHCPIDGAVLVDGLTVRYRQGGERFRPAGRGHTATLKKLLQEYGIAPWLRKKIPLLYHGDDLVAVADIWVADGYTADTGKGIVWQDRPRLN